MKFIIYHLILKPLIFRNYRLRRSGLLPDRWHWADAVAVWWNYHSWGPDNLALGEEDIFSVPAIAAALVDARLLSSSCYAPMCDPGEGRRWFYRCLQNVITAGKLDVHQVLPCVTVIGDGLMFSSRD